MELTKKSPFASPPLITCEICSGTVMVQTIDLSIGFDVIRYVTPLSANFVSRIPNPKNYIAYQLSDIQGHKIHRLCNPILEEEEY